MDVVECTSNKGTLGKVFKKDAKAIGEYLAGVTAADCDRIEQEMASTGWGRFSSRLLLYVTWKKIVREIKLLMYIPQD